MIKNLHILPRKALAVGYELGAILWGHATSSAKLRKQAQKQEQESRSFMLYKMVDTLHLTDREIEITKIDQSKDEIDLLISGVAVQVRYAVAFKPIGKKKNIIYKDEDGNLIEDSNNRLIFLVKGNLADFKAPCSSALFLKDISLDSVNRLLTEIEL